MPSCFPCDVSDTWCESCCVASKDVFERHARQLEVRSFSFDASKFVFLSVFSIYRDDMSTVCPNISAKPPSKYGKRPLPVDLHRSRPQKRLCLSSLLAKRWSTCPSWVTGDQQHENENCFLVLRKVKNHISRWNRTGVSLWRLLHSRKCENKLFMEGGCDGRGALCLLALPSPLNTCHAVE